MVAPGKGVQEEQQPHALPRLKTCRDAFELRPMIVQSIFERAQDFDVEDITVELAIRYVDSLLDSLRAPAEVMIDIAQTCLFIAMKFNESYTKRYTLELLGGRVEYFRKLELFVLGKLQWILHRDNSMSIMHEHADKQGFSPRSFVRRKAAELLRLALQERDFADRKPADLGMAAYLTVHDTFGCIPVSEADQALGEQLEVDALKSELLNLSNMSAKRARTASYEAPQSPTGIMDAVFFGGR